MKVIVPYFFRQGNRNRKNNSQNSPLFRFSGQRKRRESLPAFSPAARLSCRESNTIWFWVVYFRAGSVKMLAIRQYSCAFVPCPHKNPLTQNCFAPKIHPHRCVFGISGSTPGNLSIVEEAPPRVGTHIKPAGADASAPAGLRIFPKRLVLRTSTRRVRRPHAAVSGSQSPASAPDRPPGTSPPLPLAVRSSSRTPTVRPGNRWSGRFP